MNRNYALNSAFKTFKFTENCSANDYYNVSKVLIRNQEMMKTLRQLAESLLLQKENQKRKKQLKELKQVKIESEIVPQSLPIRQVSGIPHTFPIHTVQISRNNLHPSIFSIYGEKRGQIRQNINYYCPSQCPLLTSFKVSRYKPIKLLSEFISEENQNNQCKFEQYEHDSLENSHLMIEQSPQGYDEEVSSEPFIILKSVVKEKKIYRRKKKGVIQDRKKNVSLLAVKFAERQKKRLLIHRARKQKINKQQLVPQNFQNSNVKLQYIQSQQIYNYNMHLQINHWVQNNQLFPVLPLQTSEFLVKTENFPLLNQYQTNQ